MVRRVGNAAAEPSAQDARARSRTAIDGSELRVAFVVGEFPVVSETFVIDQVAQLMDRGVAVEIFAFKRGDPAYASERFYSYRMDRLVRYLDLDGGKLARFVCAWRKALRLGIKNPRALGRALNARRFGRDALSLKLVCSAEPLAGRNFDIVHCHFGPVARSFIPVWEVLGVTARMVTSFYGYDVSVTFRERGSDYYEPLKRHCSLYFVMSNDMKRRVVAQGFPAERVRVQPVSIQLGDYSYQVRTLEDGEPLRLVSVGRLVEKKGFDDLLRAMAIVQERAGRAVLCSIVGGGPLDQELRALARSLGLDDAVEFTGFMTIESVLSLFERMHVLAQPSKTASDGDME